MNIDLINFPDLEIFIQNQANDFFAQESTNEIKNKIENIRNSLSGLKKSLEEAKNNTDRSNLTSKMKLAYITIMRFRTLLLGSENEIDYKIYLRSTGELNKDNVQIFSLPESQVMNLIERSGNDLRLKKVFKDIDNIYLDSRANDLFKHHFEAISRSLTLKKANNYTISHEAIKDIGDPSSLPNLFWQDANGKPGKSAYSSKMFNRGWIYQAFEATVAELYQDTGNDKRVPNATFCYSYFKKHLKYDNIVGFKGGDVGLTQVKSNMANLINISTLIRYLGILITILNPIDYSDPKKLANYITQNFTEKKNITDRIRQEVNKKANEILQILQIK